MENMEENSEKNWKIQKKIELNSEKIGKTWKKPKLNSEKILKIWKKPKLNSDKIWKIQNPNDDCVTVYIVRTRIIGSHPSSDWFISCNLIHYSTGNSDF
jgi:hypothetical protein